MFYMAVVSMDIKKRMSKGIFQIVNGSIAILAGLLVRGLGSIFYLRDVSNEIAWSGLWICGSLLNLHVVTCDLVMLFITLISGNRTRICMACKFVIPG